MAVQSQRLLFKLKSRRQRYFLKEGFDHDKSSPLTSPRFCDPGPGVLTVADSTNSFSVSGGEVIPANANASITANPGMYQANGFSRVPGRALKARVQRVSALGSSGSKLVSPNVLWSNIPLSTAGASSLGLSFYNTGQFGAFKLSSQGINGLDADASDTYFVLTVILRSVGAFCIVGNKLNFVVANGNFTPCYPQVATLSTDRCPPRADYMRVIDLPHPWNSDYGIASSRLAGARSASDAFTHEGEASLEFTVTTLPSSGVVQVDFRRQDANNCWRAEIDSAGNFLLREVVAGTPTTRCSTTVANGDRCYVWVDNNAARIARDRVGTEAQSTIYSGTTSFSSQLNGLVTSLGTGGAISDLITWPRNLSGAALALINAA